MIFTPMTDEDDGSRDQRRPSDGADRGGLGADNSYLQSAHQGGFEVRGQSRDWWGGEDGDEAAGPAHADDRTLLSASSSGDQFVYDAGAHFPDLDMSGPVRFSLDGPAWAEINPATGLVSGAPGSEDLGAFAFQVVVRDASGARFSATLEFTVEMQDGAAVVTEAFARPTLEEPVAADEEAGQGAGAETPSSAAPEQDFADETNAPPGPVASEADEEEVARGPETPADQETEAAAELAPSQRAPAPADEAEEPVAATPEDEAPAEEPAPVAEDEVEEPVEAAPADEAEEPVAATPEDEAPAEEPAPVAEDEVEEPVEAAPSDAIEPVEDAPEVEQPEPPVVEAQPPAEPEPPAPPSLDQPVDVEEELSVDDGDDETPAEPEQPEDHSPENEPAENEPVEAAPAASEHLNAVNGTNKADFLVGTDKDDRIAGLRGADRMSGGAGDDVYVYTADPKNGSDVFDDGREGDGYDVAFALEQGVVIGVDGYNDGRSFSSNGVTVKSTGVDAFEGQGDTIIRDVNGARTLDFSKTELKGIQEVDARGGKDTVIASDLSDAAYRGGAGADQLIAGKADATWLYGAGKNGADSFVNGEGRSVALATDKGVVIGVNGYANGVDAFEGQGDTVIRDTNSSRTLDFSNTELTGILQVDAAGGNDTVIASELSDGAYRGGSGNDSLVAGSRETTWLYSAGANGHDTFANGAGHSVALATGADVVIGLNGYANGVDAFEGQGDTVIRDTNSSRTLDFSNTELTGIVEIDARGGNDTVIASELSDGAYRGGSGDDSLTAGSQATTWLYGAGDNGHDTFANGEGRTVARADDEGVVIGLNGYANGVDAFEGQGDTVIRDTNSSRTLDFSNTELTGILEIDARGGNDTVIASNLSDGAYRGGSGDDSLTAGSQTTTWLYGAGDNGHDTFANGEGRTVAFAEDEGVVIGLNGYANGVDAFEGQGDTVLRDTNSSRTLDFSNTELTGILEIDARGGNDTMVASNLSDGAYRGGSGDDALNAGAARATWLYGAGDNGHDTFTNGEGVSVAVAEERGVEIGLNGYANGVDGFRGAGDTVLRDTNSSRTLDFSKTAFKDVALVDAAGGNDTVIASNLSDGAYRGGSGDDTLIAGDQRTVWTYDAGDNGRDSFVNGSGDSIAQAADKGVVIGVNGYANGVDGFLGVGDTVIRDGNSSRTLDFSDTAFKGVAEIDGAGGNDRIVVSNLSEGSYRGGSGNDVFVVQRGAESAVIKDFDDSGNDRIDLSAFGTDRGAIEKATSLVDSDGDGEADDVQIDLSALGGEKGSTLTLLDTDLKALNFGSKNGDFIVEGEASKAAQLVDHDDGAAAERLFTFDADSLDQDSGWTAELEGGKWADDPGADAFFEHGGGEGLIVFEDGSDQVFASINDSQW